MVKAAGNAPGLVEVNAAAEPLPVDQPLDNGELVEVEAAAPTIGPGGLLRQLDESESGALALDFRRNNVVP